ncbi:MAG: NifB/NifX family molybdenum-iron cluster-binding protein [Candidatus Bathyarchaeia archaeon]
MTDRVVVPAEDQKGLDARLAEHFGRAPYFAVVDLDESGEVSNVKTVANVGEHAGGVGQAHDHILELKPNAIIVYGMGPRGLTSFQSAGIAVLKANADTVCEVIASYKENKLQELTEGCEHAHHHNDDHTDHDTHHH